MLEVACHPSCTANPPCSLHRQPHLCSCWTVQGFALDAADQRKAVLSCLCTFLDALDAVTSAQQGLQDAGSVAVEGAQEQAMATSPGKSALL